MITENSINAYFLGELPDGESRRLEEESLRNEDLFDLLRATEETLIDAYVRGEMTLERKTLFEQNYLNTQRRRQAVELASALMQKYNREATNPAHAAATAPISYLLASMKAIQSFLTPMRDGDASIVNLAERIHEGGQF